MTCEGLAFLAGDINTTTHGILPPLVLSDLAELRVLLPVECCLITPHGRLEFCAKRNETRYLYEVQISGLIRDLVRLEVIVRERASLLRSGRSMCLLLAPTSR